MAIPFDIMSGANLAARIFLLDKQKNLNKYLIKKLLLAVQKEGETKPRLFELSSL